MKVGLIIEQKKENIILPKYSTSWNFGLGEGAKWEFLISENPKKIKEINMEPKNKKLDDINSKKMLQK